MELSIQTPALLFPAVSLLLIAYTNKFLAIATLIRKLVSDYEEQQKHDLLRQIRSLRRRLMLIRWMQVLGVASILVCVVTMYFIYEGWQIGAKLLFAISLLLMMASLVITMLEIVLSAGALRVLLKDLEERNRVRGGKGGPENVNPVL
jgi:magnesium-transporting ATPase (P-type)